MSSFTNPNSGPLDAVRYNETELACSKQESPKGLPVTAPDDCESSPDKVTIPKKVNEDINTGWSNSFPEGRSQEQGGTIVQNKDGSFEVINKGSGSSGQYTRNTSVGAGQTLVGTYHTHPYDETEGGYEDISFSGGDIGNMVNASKEKVKIVQSGDSQFMLVRTGETPGSVDNADVESEWENHYNQAKEDGKNFSEATRIAAKRTASNYGFAYYEGSEGVLTKVNC